VEGIGGALVPITENMLLADVIQALQCSAIVVARDALGTLNHSLLTLNELRRRKISVEAIVLMKNFSDDPSAKTNSLVLSQHVALVRVVTLPKLLSPGFRRARNPRQQSFLKKTIAALLQLSIFSPRWRCHNEASWTSKRQRGRASL
jgi:dethiobiotin synthetase